MAESTQARSNVSVVTDFLEALAVPDTERALASLSPDIVWRNTGLPTFRGERVLAVLRDMEKRGIGFGVEVHAIAEHGDMVLTDRTDHLWKGPLKTAFWVRGTFTIRDGLIDVWDDAFSMGNLFKGFIKH